MKSTLILATLSVFALAATGCSDPPPPPGSPLALEAVVGTWQGGNGFERATLSIAPDGTLRWERVGATKTTLNGAKVENLTTTGFDANLFVSVHFVLNAPPHEDAGVVTMTVDGIVLQKQTGTDTNAMQTELERLKAENAALKRGHDDDTDPHLVR